MTTPKQRARQHRAALMRTFNGKLVPQDPNDEPVSALLERLRKERGSAKAKQLPQMGTGDGSLMAQRRRK